MQLRTRPQNRKSPSSGLSRVMGFCISNRLIWFSSKSVICDHQILLTPKQSQAEEFALLTFLGFH